MARTYDKSLVEWITIGLHRSKLAEAVDAMERGKKISIKSDAVSGTIKYIEKILREEAMKQFSDTRRPVLEVILNSIDARPEDMPHDYVINVVARKPYVTIADNGSGMTLDEILRLLIIPFSTEKEGIEEIGRFGVGFLSTFNYCLEAPSKNRVQVLTQTDSGAYSATFYSTGKKVSDIRMKIRKSRGKGPAETRVIINRNFGTKEFLSEYITDHLKTMSPLTALINVNGKPINDVGDKKLYTSPVELDVRDRTVRQRLGVLFHGDITKKMELSSFRKWWIRATQAVPSGVIEDLENGLFNKERMLANYIDLTAQGVRVKKVSTEGVGRGATIYFPAAVKLVEGRDEFKLDDNYNRCVSAVFDVLDQYVQDHKLTDRFVSGMVNFIPALMAAFEMRQLEDLPNLEAITNSLLPGKEYVVTKGETDRFAAFFGEKVRAKCFETTSQGCSFWRDRYRSGIDLMKDHLSVIRQMSPYSFIQKVQFYPDFYPNLRPLSKAALMDKYERVTLVEIGEHGTQPTLTDEETLYINVSHPAVSATEDPVHKYTVLSEYFASTAAINHEILKDKDRAEFKIIHSLTKKLLTLPADPEHIRIRYNSRRKNIHDQNKWKKKYSKVSESQYIISVFRIQGYLYWAGMM